MEHNSPLKQNTVPQLTLDTSVILEYLKEQRRASIVEKLLTLVETREVELAVTARIREDVSLPPLADRINELDALHISEVGTIARFGYWLLDGNHHFGLQEFVEFSEEVTAMLEKDGVKHRIPDWRDWDHVHAHYLFNRDIFLTWDKPLLSIRDKLLARFGIIVMTPEAYLDSHAVD